MANQAFNKVKTVRPDSKGRITLGKASHDVSGYVMKELADGVIMLEPMVEVPAREAWLFKNKEALESVERGLKQSAAGKTKSLGSFAQFLEDDDKE